MRRAGRGKAISTIVTDLLQTGTNILAIQGLNYSASDPSFLILPQLSANVTSVYGTDGKIFRHAYSRKASMEPEPPIWGRL